MCYVVNVLRLFLTCSLVVSFVYIMEITHVWNHVGFWGNILLMNHHEMDDNYIKLRDLIIFAGCFKSFKNASFFRIIIITYYSNCGILLFSNLKMYTLWLILLNVFKTPCTNLSIMTMHTHKIECYLKTTRNNQYILKLIFMEHKLITIG